MLIVDGKKYYKVSEVAVLTGVNARTLRRWIGDGDLAHFLFPYKRRKGAPLYYRLEPPEAGDQRIEGDDSYRLPNLSEAAEEEPQDRKDGNHCE